MVLAGQEARADPEGSPARSRPSRRGMVGCLYTFPKKGVQEFRKLQVVWEKSSFVWAFERRTRVLALPEVADSRVH